jgi:hypothetical protein
MKTTITRAVTGLASAVPMMLLAATTSAQTLTASSTGVMGAATTVNTGAGAEVFVNLALLSISAVAIVAGAVYATRSDRRLAR